MNTTIGRAGLAFLVILAVIVAGVFYLGGAAEKPKTVTGEVVDLHCYMHSGLKGPGHEACAISCAKGGEPIGLLQNKTNKVYLLLAPEHPTPGGQNPAVKLLVPYMAKQVTIKGERFTRGGLNAIVVSKISKA